LDHTVVADRFTGTAVLSTEAARDLGTLGYVARASGLGLDARRDHPFTDLGEFPVATRTSGDVLARVQVRADEIATSVELIVRLLDGMTPGAEAVEVASAGPGVGVGVAEGWRGTIVHRVELTPDGALARVKVVDPSFFNWPALPVA